MAADGLWLFPKEKREAAQWLEQFRQYNESEKQWDARKQFLLRHVRDYPGEKLDQLLSLSMVWANHVFMGCRYGTELMQKILAMADGIDLGQMPSYELVLDAKVQKRPCSSDNGKEAPKKQATSMFHVRPRFEPVHFVASSKTEDENVGTGKSNNSLNNEYSKYFTEGSSPQGLHEQLTSSPFQSTKPFSLDSSFPSTSTYQVESKTQFGGFMAKLSQNYTTKLQAHYSTQANNYQANKPGLKSGTVLQRQWDSGFPGSNSKTSVGFSKNNYLGSTEFAIDGKQMLINKLVTSVAKTLADPEVGGFSDKMQFTYILTRCIQACKTNPEYIYVPLKEISPLDLPKNKKLPTDGYACELRYQSVYLATGYSGSKNGARDRATEQALKLLLKPCEVRVVSRKLKHSYINDLVASQRGVPVRDFPPILRHTDDNKGSDFSHPNDPYRKKQWTEFVIIENARDAIGILNNSASVNKMAVDYKYDQMPNLAWRCTVYLQDHRLAEGYGNKKSCKHAAAEEALRVLRRTQPVQSPSHQLQNGTSQVVGNTVKNPNRKRNLNEIVVLENASNAVSVLNDTAQFNKMAIEYTYDFLPNQKWRCRVFLEGQFIAEAVGSKKTVKHTAAEATLAILKKSNLIVKSNLRRGCSEEAISRNQILGRSSSLSFKQQIKEDNIGNQLLRKMGWTGGGLGKEGEGIAEPISVKEQYTREGLGLDLERGGTRLGKRDIDEVIRNYACSNRQDELTFSKELTNEERKQIHQIAQKYGLKSKSYGKAMERFLVVSRKVRKEDLIDQLKQEFFVKSWFCLILQKL
uniref:NFKB repressing factor n=1 Tax=Latimeria chalumnae TaxID=7897 RepID=H3AMQ3_LATCH